MNSEKFRAAAGIVAVHVPMKGTPEAITETIAGLRPGTPDNAPLLGELDGVVFATGHHRNGVLLTPVTAELVAAHLAGEAELPAAFSPGRFAGAAA